MTKVILFDFDGPLADSFSAHIEFCWRMSQKYLMQKAPPEVTDLNAWKKLIGFPMTDFLMNIGFSKEQAQQIYDNDYLPEFGRQKNPARLHSGVTELISELKNLGNTLGIVSLNTRGNILASLGELAEKFSVIYSCDEYPTKPPALTAATLLLGSTPEKSIYIGDALNDHAAACEVQMPFIGVSYGWSITGEEEGIVSAESPAHLKSMLIAV